MWTGKIFPTNGAQGVLRSKLIGKNLTELLGALTTPNDSSHCSDAVSSATISSNAVKYAIADAMQNKPVEENDSPVLMPTIKVVGNYTVQTGTSGRKYIRLNVPEMNQSRDIYYTTDGSEPTLDSTRAAVQIQFDQPAKDTPAIVPVKFAAFEDGQKSNTVTVYLVFCKQPTGFVLDKGTYESATGDISVSVTIDIVGIRKITLDADTTKTSAAFLDELLAQVYLEQDPDAVKPLEGYDTAAQQKILDAISAAVEQAKRPPTPTATITPDLKNGYSYGPYNYENPPTIELSDAMAGSEIYYSFLQTYPNTTTKQYNDSWLHYTGSIVPQFSNEQGGKLYLVAAATKDNCATWSDTRVITLQYNAKQTDSSETE